MVYFLRTNSLADSPIPLSKGFLSASYRFFVPLRQGRIFLPRGTLLQPTSPEYAPGLGEHLQSVQ
jgi:hypothetical protein